MSSSKNHSDQSPKLEFRTPLRVKSEMGEKSAPIMRTDDVKASPRRNLASNHPIEDEFYGRNRSIQNLRPKEQAPYQNTYILSPEEPKGSEKNLGQQKAQHKKKVFLKQSHPKTRSKSPIG